MKTLDFSAVKPLFTSKKKIIITSHSNPDGDAIGSVLALYNFFRAGGHEVYAMVPNNFPDFLAWLPGHENVLLYDKNKKECDRIFSVADVLFALDYNSPSRINSAAGTFTQANGTKIMIDHHIDPETSAFQHCFSTTAISSTSELVFEFILQMDESLLNQEIAEAIYVGIMTDTGSFSYNCNFESTFTASAYLISKGIDAAKINRLVYSNNREIRLRLLGYALSEKLTVIREYNTAYIALTREELARFDNRTGDTEGLVNYALSIEGIRFAALFTERENKIRISFRSAGEFSVNEFARRHFQGGGHRNAAGGDSFSDMDQTLKIFNHLLSEYKEELK